LDGGELAAEDDRRRELPRQITPSNASNAPANMPGKKPAAIAAPGKRVHRAAIGGAFESIPVPLLAAVVGEFVGLGKEVNDEVPAVDVAVAVDAEFEEDGFREL
jgi:hypothetical protein